MLIGYCEIFDLTCLTQGMCSTPLCLCPISSRAKLAITRLTSTRIDLWDQAYIKRKEALCIPQANLSTSALHRPRQSQLFQSCQGKLAELVRGAHAPRRNATNRCPVVHAVKGMQYYFQLEVNSSSPITVADLLGLRASAVMTLYIRPQSPLSHDRRTSQNLHLTALITPSVKKLK